MSLQTSVESLPRVVLPADEGEKCELLVVLQNAWAKERPKRDWRYEEWLCFLWWSKTGKNLTRCLGPDCTGMVFTNTTPIISVGNHTVKPQAGYVKSRIDRHKPRVVLACGAQAQAEVRKVWAGPAVFMPHPGSRFLEHQSRVFVEVRELMDRRGELKGFIKVDRDRVTGDAVISSVA